MTDKNIASEVRQDRVAEILGIGELYTNADRYATMKKEILEKADYTVPGYLYDYLHYRTDGALEYEYCYNHFSGKDDCRGIDIHCSSNDYFPHVSVLNTIEADASAPYYQVQLGKEGPAVPARIICPDVMANIEEAKHVDAQAILFSNDIQITKGYNEKKLEAANEPCMVAFSSHILRIRKTNQHFFGIAVSYWEMRIMTPAGLITLVVPSHLIKEQPEGHCTITGKGILSLDVAMPSTWRTVDKRKITYADFLPEAAAAEYKLGYIPGEENALEILSRCLTSGDFRRFARCCGKSVYVGKAQDRTYPVPFSTLPGELREITGFEILSAEHSHLISCPQKQFQGAACLVLHGEDGQSRILTIETDKRGIVSTITALDGTECSYAIDYELNRLATLAKAMSGPSPQKLADVLAGGCIYRSEYAERQIVGGYRIMQHMEKVASVLNESNHYTFEIVPAEDELRTGDSLPEIYSGRWCVREFQDGFEGTAAVVFLSLDEENKIQTILLSRDSRYVKAVEAQENAGGCYNPYTILPLSDLISTAFDTDEPLRALRNAEIPENDKYDIYVWKQADAFARRFLRQNSYTIDRYGIEDECLGYECDRKGTAYAVYVYAFGEKPTAYVSAETCAYLQKLKHSSDRKVLVIYLKVRKTVAEDGTVSYQTGAYYDADKAPDIWLLKELDFKPRFLYYPRQEVYDLVFRFRAAFNTRNLDILRSICDDAITLTWPDGKQETGDGFYEALSYLYLSYGEMKIAYVSFNRLTYCVSPCLERFCHINLSVNKYNKITEVKLSPLEDSIGEEYVVKNYRDLFYWGYYPEKHPADDVPQLETVSYLPPAGDIRFTIELTFKNGETRRFIINEALAGKVPTPDGKALDEEAFHAGRIVEHIAKPEGQLYDAYPERGQGIEFANGLALSTVELYHDSYPIGEFNYAPIDGISVTPDDFGEDWFAVGKIWDMDPRNPEYLFDRRTCTAKELPEIYWDTPMGSDFGGNFWGGYSDGRVMVSTIGELPLQYHHNFRNSAGMWGWLDTDLNVVIPPQYVYALNFVYGHAVVCKGEWTVNDDGEYWCEEERWGVIDTDGKEVVPCLFDELYTVDNTNRLFLIHTGGWEDGHYGIYDSVEQVVILDLDFNFDKGYMFNECYVDENNLLIFDDHLAGKETDLLTVYDLQEKRYLMHQMEWNERTYNGEKSLTVQKDGKDIIIF